MTDIKKIGSIWHYDGSEFYFKICGISKNGQYFVEYYYKKNDEYYFSIVSNPDNAIPYKKPEPKVSYEKWVNLYPDDSGLFHNNKNKANEQARHDRIALLHIRIIPHETDLTKIIEVLRRE